MFCFSRPFSSFCVCLFFSFSLCRLSLSTFSTLLLSTADLLPWPGTTYVWSLGWTQNHCYQGKCIQTSHNDFHLKPVHKHSQMLTDTLSLLRQAGRMLFSSAEAAVSQLVSLIPFLIGICLFVCALVRCCLFGCLFYDSQQSFFEPPLELCEPCVCSATFAY